MKRLLSLCWLLVCLIVTATPSCAAPLKASQSRQQGITRIGFAIQVGAFREVKNAERLAARLQEKGIEAFYFRKENGVYAVRFGDFSSRESARQTAAKLQREKILTSYFIASPSDTVLTKRHTAELHKPVEPGTTRKPAVSGTGMGSIAARTAERFVGIPYRWGGDTVVDGMDCSGFVRAVYNLCGVNIPRTSREQYRVGESVGLDGLKDGDLVFFGESEDRINHVGIYVGDNKFVHAPRRGDDIKVTSLEESYFTKRFIGGRRYF